MTVVIGIILPVLGILSVIVAIVFGAQALGARGRIQRQAYGVGQQEARRAMQLGMLRAIGALILGAVFLVVWGVTLSTASDEPAASPASSTPGATTAATALPTVSATAAAATATPTIPPPVTLSPAVTQTPATTATPAFTPTPPASPSPPTALVSSGVGVWLRSEPSTDGEQLEYVLDGSVVFLLTGQVQGETYLWQEVRTPAGNEGWVAVDFLAEAP